MKTVPLGEVAKIDRTSVAPGEMTGRYIGLEHLDSSGGIDVDHKIDIAELASSKFKFSPDHVLFGKLRPYLRKIARPSFAGVCSTDILPILPKPSLDKDYLYHFLRTPQIIDLATARSSGANLPRISPGILAEFPIPLPPLPEQKRIAAILDKADAIRRKREQSLQLAQQFLRSLFLEMFGDPVQNPKSWPKTTFGETIEEGPQNGLYRPSLDYGSGTPIVRIDSFDGGGVVDVSNLRRLRIASEVASLFGLRQNDILINRVNSRSHLGKSTVVPAISEPIVFESNMMRLSVRSEIAHPTFILYLLQTPFIKAQIQSVAKDAVNQSSINQDDVRSLVVLIPPLELQLRFADIVESVREMTLRLQEGQRTQDVLAQTLNHLSFS